MCHIETSVWTCGHTDDRVIHYCARANALVPDPDRCQNPTRNQDMIRLNGVCQECWKKQNPEKMHKEQQEAKKKEEEEKEKQCRLEEWEEFLPDEETVDEEEDFVVTAGPESIPEDANVGQAKQPWFWPFGAKAKAKAKP